MCGIRGQRGFLESPSLAAQYRSLINYRCYSGRFLCISPCQILIIQTVQAYYLSASLSEVEWSSTLRMNRNECVQEACDYFGTLDYVYCQRKQTGGKAELDLSLVYCISLHYRLLCFQMAPLDRDRMLTCTWLCDFSRCAANCLERCSGVCKSCFGQLASRFCTGSDKP